MSTAARAGASKLASLGDVLPRRFGYPWQRTRILERARAFEQRLANAEANGDLGKLRDRLVQDWLARGGVVELHGVASHFEPETFQAHFRDASGETLYIRVQDSAGRWVDRRDLVSKVRAARIPSSVPGRGAGSNRIATFAIARMDRDGRVRPPEIPAEIGRFLHLPRVRPFQVGDIVQVVQATGKEQVATRGEPYAPKDVTVFGRILSTDGTGNWTIECVEGKEKRFRVRVTDSELRRDNNPHVLFDGDRLMKDCHFHSGHPAQVALMKAWRGSNAYAELIGARPPLDADPKKVAKWQISALETINRWIGNQLVYPHEIGTDDEVRAWRARLVELNELLARGDLKEDERWLLAKERTGIEERPQLRLQDLEIELLSVEERLPSDGKLHPRELDKEAASLRERIEKVQALIEKDRRHWALAAAPSNVGEYFVNGTGACRHQSATAHVLAQDLGLDVRHAFGAALTPGGVFRDWHSWLEVQLADGTWHLCDPTWGAVMALDAAYELPKRKETPGHGDVQYGALLADRGGVVEVTLA